MSLSCGFALRPTDNSSDFSNAFHSIIGDGIAQYGGRFAVNSVNGFTVTLSTGYAFAAGHWVENNETHRMTVQPSGNNADRTDALVLRVNYAERKATLEIFVGVDPTAVRSDPSVLRNDDEYSVFLYFIRVKRGATSLSPSDITDVRVESALCGSVVPYSSVAGDVLYVYNFLTSGIDERVMQIIELCGEIGERADEAATELDEVIKKADGLSGVGDLTTCRRRPAPEEEWILCDGGTVPEEYPALSEMLSGNLPALSAPDDRYCTYIYGGRPVVLEG